MTQRPALLVSQGRLPSARAVWDHRSVLGATPEFHLVDPQGRFLEAAETRTLYPEFALGLDYEGTFFDALNQKRLTVVLPLLSRTDGAVQGLLEFVGVPYAGCGMTSAILAQDPRRGQAVLGSLGLDRAPPHTPTAVLVAVLGNEDSVVGDAGNPEAEEFCRRVYRGLGLGGWALIGAAPMGDGWGWTSIEVQPDLSPEGPFCRSLRNRNWDLDAVIERVLRWGRSRHAAEVTLKSLFKDKL